MAACPISVQRGRNTLRGLEDFSLYRFVALLLVLISLTSVNMVTCN